VNREYVFYFAWCQAGTPWDISLARFDESIFDLLISHDEGQIPEAVIQVKNPQSGFLNPLKPHWAWISYSLDACGPLPLFFGRLTGVPEELEGFTVKMKLIARPGDYVYQKQQVARSLKIAPNYDGLFFDVFKRDDPDAILEGWSALYHVDRVNHRVSVSDILAGEDGTVNFAPSEVFYDSVKMVTLQPPLVAVNVKAEVAWQQQYRGTFYVGQWAFPTLGGDPFVADWPKSGSSLGGGWSAGIAWAGERDPDVATAMLKTLAPQVPSVTFSWTNTDKHHKTGDKMSVSINYTPTWGKSIELNKDVQLPMIDVGAVDENGDPDPVNIPARTSIDYFCYKTYDLDFLGKQSVATLSLIYAADRKRSERVEMTVKADVQPFLIDPTVPEDTEQITLKSGDLSQPLINLLNWDTVGFGGHVEQGLIIFPDNPLVPGQTSSQVALNSGATGMTFPTFSNIAGQVTIDGDISWVSLGDTPPSDGAQDWVRSARVSAGTIIMPKPISGVPNLQAVRMPGLISQPPIGVPVPRFAIFCQNDGGPGDTMLECTTPGLVGGNAPQAVFHTFVNPSGAFQYISLNAGETGLYHTTFNETLHSQTTDNGVTWQNIGRAELPIGGWPGMTPAATFFPSDRGLRVLENMFCRARAKLRKRARAVQLSFDTRFEAAAMISCRMNGSLDDIRLPGQTVSGKVISYKLIARGDGTIKGNVVLGCSIGNGSSPSQSTTDIPSYVDEGYVDLGYQEYYSANTLLTPGDPNYAPPGTLATQTGNPQPIPEPVNWPHEPPTLPPQECRDLIASKWIPSVFEVDAIGYTPPLAAANDDGVIFPIVPADVILQSQWHGTASTLDQTNIQRYKLEVDQVVHDAVAQANQPVDIQFVIDCGVLGIQTTTYPVPPFYDIQVAVQQAILQNDLLGNALWYELVLKPLTNGPFANSYVVQITPLSIPKTVDLTSPPAE